MRDRGAASETIVFGILEGDGEASVKIMKNVKQRPHERNCEKG